MPVLNPAKATGGEPLGFVVAKNLKDAKKIKNLALLAALAVYFWTLRRDENG
jgi:hypothetical protein